MAKKKAAKKSTKKAAKKPAKKKTAGKTAAKPKATAKAKARPAKKAAAKPAKKAPKAPKAPKAAAETPTDIAARMGRKSAEVMVLEGENQSPDETLLQEWAYDWFLNAGGFDAIKGSDDNDPDQQAAIKQSFFDAFKTAMRTRLNIAQPNALG